MQCFVTKRKQVEGRIDPSYYRPSIVRYVDELKLRKAILISDIADVVCGPFGSSITVKDYREEGIPLVRISNMKEGGLVYDEVAYISKELASKLRAYKVRENDLIISQRGTLGLTAKVDSYFDGSVISANLIAMKNIKRVIPDFLRVFLASDYGKMQLMRQTSGQVQTKITTDDVKRIRVPLIPRTLQVEIVNLIDNAHRVRRQMEAEAKELLDSIDGYMLSELRVELPNTADKRYYAVGLNDMDRRRLDPYFYQPKFTSLIESLEKSDFSVKNLGELSRKVVNGLDFRKYEARGIPYLRVSNIKPNRFDLTDMKYIPEFNISKDISLSNGDLLITRKGTFGVAAVVTDEYRNMTISSEIFRVVLDQSAIDPFYAAFWLNTRFAQLMIDRMKTGGIMGHLSQEALQDIKLPVPTIEKQKTIAKEVNFRINTATDLQRQGNQELVRAKAFVEKMILG